MNKFDSNARILLTAYFFFCRFYRKKATITGNVARAAFNRLPVFFLDSPENFPHSPVSYLLRRLQKTKMIKIKRRICQ